jgi:transglutaminase-like putative cysteine protease
MMKLMILSVLVLGHHLSLLAGDGEYAVAKIPLQLLKGANSVVRQDEQRVVVKNLEKMVLRNHYVITILNEKGDEHADWIEAYDNFNSIESIEGALYDADGKKIKSLKKNEIRDVSITSDNLAVDGRLKVHNFYYKVYPYTVEYTVETVKKETMFFPQWIPVPDEFVAVEKSSMSVEVPVGYKLRYKTFNYDKEPIIKSIDKFLEYTWEIKEYEPVIAEYYSPGWKSITPVVMMAPSEFIIEDYQGKMSDWKELGLFQASLNKGRDVLSADIKQKVQEIIKDAKTKKEKIHRLYQYLQNNTRYISIQLGVGGWRPFEATYVSAKGYGDCKALSNYMYSLLKEAGILSYYTLVKAGNYEEDIVVDFPSRQFNHVIVCVPDVKDTIWLECTSQTTPPGYMGKFTGNRHALLITEEGGKLVQTPRYSLKENLQTRNIKAVLEENGTLKVIADTKYTGMQQDDIHGRINALSKEKVKEHLQEQLDFSTYDINQFDYKEQKSSLPAINESLDITVSNYATITGKRLFIVPNVMTRSGRKLSQDTARKYDIQLGFEYKDVDSVEIELPKGYETEAMPKDVSISSQFGKYSSSVKLKDNKLYYYRVIEHNSGRFPAKDYAALVEFYGAIYKADRSRVVLVKNEKLKAF